MNILAHRRGDRAAIAGSEIAPAVGPSILSPKVTKTLTEGRPRLEFWPSISSYRILGRLPLADNKRRVIALAERAALERRG